MFDMESGVQSELAIAESSEMMAMELSEDDLDCVSGGRGVTQGSSSGFNQSNLRMGRQTFAGPNGAGSTQMLEMQDISSFANDFASMFD